MPVVFKTFIRPCIISLSAAGPNTLDEIHCDEGGSVLYTLEPPLLLAASSPLPPLPYALEEVGPSNLIGVLAFRICYVRAN